MQNDDDEVCDAYIRCPHCELENHVCELLKRDGPDAVDAEGNDATMVGGEFAVNCEDCKEPFVLIEEVMISYSAFVNKDIYNN